MTARNLETEVREIVTVACDDFRDLVAPGEWTIETTRAWRNAVDGVINPAVVSILSLLASSAERERLVNWLSERAVVYDSTQDESEENEGYDVTQSWRVEFTVRCTDQDIPQDFRQALAAVLPPPQDGGSEEKK